MVCLYNNTDNDAADKRSRSTKIEYIFEISTVFNDAAMRRAPRRTRSPSRVCNKSLPGVR